MLKEQTTPEAAARAPAAANATAAIVDRWFNERLQNSPLSRNTELYNVVYAAKEELKALLAAAA